MQIIKAVPTNIITGALGVGKTTFIMQLLRSKPADERWAVLVNEFGEVGIDGALLSCTYSKQSHDGQSIFVREIPGGCMCCTSGLPMQIALNQLLAAARPHRLLIEPTGLGHPKELIEVLCSEHYKEVISLQTVLCLTDARKLHEPKWRAHQTFREQFQIADHIIATKHDLYHKQDKAHLTAYVEEVVTDDVPITTAIHGEVNADISRLISQANKVRFGNVKNQLSTLLQQRVMSSHSEDLELPTRSTSVVKKANSGEDFHSRGWIWPANQCFDFAELSHAFKNLVLVRIKAVIITNEGIFGFNCQENELVICEYDEAIDSRLEFIAHSNQEAEAALEIIEGLYKA